MITFSDDEPMTNRKLIAKQETEMQSLRKSTVNDIDLDNELLDKISAGSKDSEEFKDEPSELIRQSTKGLPPLVLTSSLLSKSKEREKKRKRKLAERHKLNEVGLPTFKDYRNRS